MKTSRPSLHATIFPALVVAALIAVPSLSAAEELEQRETVTPTTPATPPVQVETAIPATVKTEPLSETLAPSPETEIALEQGREKRFSVSLAGSIIGILIPTKYGPAASWSPNRRWTLEASYFAGTYGFSSSYIDVGGFKENLLILNARYFPSARLSSFNFIFGLSRQQYVASLGNDIVSRFTAYAPDYNITIETLGLQLGFGNRWAYKNILFGVDWLVLNFPFAATRTNASVLDAIANADDRRRVDDAIRIMRYLPTGALFKLSLGFAF